MLARSLTLNMIGYGTTLVLGFVGSVLVARLLGPADRGLLALEVSVASFAYALLAVGMPMSVEYFAGRRERPGALLGTIAAYAAALAVVVVPLAWVFRGFVADVFARGNGGATWVLAAALIPLLFLQYAAANQLSGVLRFGLFNLLMVVSKIVYTVVVVALLYVGLGVTAGLAATAVAAVVTIAGAARAILRSDRLRADVRLFRGLVSYGARLQVGSVLQYANARLDVLILQIFQPLAHVGYYVVAQIVAELVGTVSNGFQTSVLPLVAAADDEDDRDRTTLLALRHQALLTAVAIVGAAVLGPLLLVYGYGPEYRASLVPMLIILPGIWFLNAGSVVAASLSGRGRPGTASTLSAVAVVVTVALDLALIPPLGVVGGAVASLCAYVAFGVTGLLLMARIARRPVLELVCPTRSDLAAYPRAARGLVARIRQVRSLPT